MLRHFITAWLTLMSAGAFAATATSYFDFDLRHNYYLGERENSGQAYNYTILSGDVNFEAETKHFKYKVNPVAEGTFEVPNELYYGMPEIFVQPKIANGFNATIGRQRRTWSRLDEEFNLGVWQPQLRWDYLAPRQQGLFGVFLDFTFSDSLQVLFFTSPMFLPDQGPNYQLNNGEFSSGNRWFIPPQNVVRLFNSNSDTPLSFTIDRPAEEKILLHSSFGVGFRYQNPGEPFWLQANYAYKPENQIHLGIECLSNCGQLGGHTALEINAIIHATVINSHVFTVESGFDRVDDQGYVSLTGDFPNASGFPSTYAESPLSQQIIAGAAYQHYLYPLVHLPVWMKYAYLKVFDIHTRDENGLADTDQSYSSLDRYPYREVAAAEAKILFRQKKTDRLEGHVRYSYSVSESGGWLSAGLDWLNGPLTYSLGLDFIGSDTASDSPNAGLYTRYRENDRLFAGVNYVF